jgi:hypothetical protein
MASSTPWGLAIGHADSVSPVAGLMEREVLSPAEVGIEESRAIVKP